MMAETSTDVATLSVRIEATPDRVLSPNSRVHWSYRMRAKNDLGTATYLAMRTVVPEMGGPENWALFERVPLTLSWTIYWGKGRKRQDADNVIASLKAAQDAVATALSIDDRYYRIGTVEQARDPDGRGYMILTITGNPATGTGGTGEDGR